jgi:hypothetical protein
MAPQPHRPGGRTGVEPTATAGCCKTYGQRLVGTKLSGPFAPYALVVRAALSPPALTHHDGIAKGFQFGLVLLGYQRQLQVGDVEMILGLGRLCFPQGVRDCAPVAAPLGAQRDLGPSSTMKPPPTSGLYLASTKMGSGLPLRRAMARTRSTVRRVTMARCSSTGRAAIAEARALPPANGSHRSPRGPQNGDLVSFIVREMRIESHGNTP